jgi:threonine aldolase
MLAQGLSAIPGLMLDFGLPQTNMVFCSLTDEVPLEAAQVARALAERGVRVGVVGARRFRLVTHYWIGEAQVAQTLQAFREVIGQG